MVGLEEDARQFAELLQRLDQESFELVRAAIGPLKRDHDLYTGDNGTLRLIGTSNSVGSSKWGVFISDDAYWRLLSTTFSGNTTDLALTFGATARLVGSTPSTVACDGTQLLATLPSASAPAVATFRPSS